MLYRVVKYDVWTFSEVVKTPIQVVSPDVV